MLVNEFIEIELNIDTARYLVYTDYIDEYNDYSDDDDDYFTYEEYEEECELDEDDWVEDADDDNEEDWCLNFVCDNSDIRTITIPICYLDDNSSEIIDIQCDCCGKIYQDEYGVHANNYYDGYDDLCPDCR